MQQNIYFGIDKLPEILNGSSISKLFIVTGANSYMSLNFKDIIERFDIERVYFTDFTPNPKFEQICKGIEMFKSEGCDAMLAIGGGSPMDVAKCIKLAVLADEGINAIIPPIVNKNVDIDGKKIPFMAIPTTAGTGSESTHNAVMYYEGAKQTVTNDGILPDYAILEPSVLKTLPLYQKKCTMMDALCQGIESWWSVNSTDESKEYSKKAVELIIQNWEKYIFGNDEVAAANIMLGANYSGRAINIAQTTAAHAMSYRITSLYGLPHGHAVAVCLPEIWEYMVNNMDKCIDPRGRGYLNDIFIQISLSMGCEDVMDTIGKFRNILLKFRINIDGKELDEEQLSLLANSVNPIRLKNNPIQIKEYGICNIYKVIFSKRNSYICHSNH